jgi:hypothetical protein
VLCRYQRGSEVCERFAQSLHHLTAIEERELFDFGSRKNEGEGGPVLLVLDRRDDPVTPLLSQWTYQASRVRPEVDCLHALYALHACLKSTYGWHNHS